MEDTFATRFLRYDRRGRLKAVGLYHDPLLGRTHMGPKALGLAPAFYMLPQNREMAEFLYRNAVTSVGWNRSRLPVLGPTSEPRMFSLGLLLAREFGDHTTERRLLRKLGRFENGRYFCSDDAGAEDEFGYFFTFNERYPRGQESALLMLRELLGGEGELAAAKLNAGAGHVPATSAIARTRIRELASAPVILRSMNVGCPCCG